MFRRNHQFNQDISDWNMTSATVTNMSHMFNGAPLFNQAIPTSSNSWNVSNVTNMSDMFYED